MLAIKPSVRMYTYQPETTRFVDSSLSSHIQQLYCVFCFRISWKTLVLCCNHESPTRHSFQFRISQPMQLQVNSNRTRAFQPQPFHTYDLLSGSSFFLKSCGVPREVQQQFLEYTFINSCCLGIIVVCVEFSFHKCKIVFHLDAPLRGQLTSKCGKVSYSLLNHF